MDNWIYDDGKVNIKYDNGLITPFLIGSVEYNNDVEYEKNENMVYARFPLTPTD